MTRRDNILFAIKMALLLPPFIFMVWFLDLSGWTAVVFMIWYFYDMIVSDIFNAIKTNK